MTMVNDFGNRTSIVSAFALLLVCSCSRKAESIPQSPFRYDQQVGIANLHGSDGCLASANPAIDSGARITLVDQPAENLAFQTPIIAEATMVERLKEDCDDQHMYTQEFSLSGPTYYRIRLKSDWSGNSYVFAILDPLRPVTANGKNVEGDLDGDGTKETFRICTSSEGAHFQVWTGQPLEGRPRWHWYVYAGYDTENVCTEKEYFGRK